ncbi:hypothetical protein DBR34_07050 [Stenotrophomonas sp. HMWF003]|nr:hypothetical protein DBR34_07050 [Stenotrophomonas sp. HMWF003]
MKDAGMRIRLEPELREAFVDKCRLQNTCAAQVLREFMRAYVFSQDQLSQSSVDNIAATIRDR